MALIEILLGERTQQGLVGGITYDPNDRLLHGVINGASDREPITELHERFAKLKARDNLLGAVLAKLGADPSARETEAHNAVGRLLSDREAVSKIADCYVKAAEGLAQGFGLSATKPDELAAQVLAMNTELTAELAKAEKRHEADDAAWGRLADAFSLGTGDPDKITGQLVAMDAELTAALSSSQAEVKALTEENARLRAGVEQERGHKLHAMTAADIAISRSAELEAEVRILKAKIAEADLERMLAEARLWGLASELQHLEVAMRKKLRA